MRVLNVTRNRVLVDDLEVAHSFMSSLVGLMGRRELAEGRGLWIKPSQSVHTLWMRFPIDVVFVDTDYRVVHLVENMKPFRVSRHVGQARSVVELPVGVIGGTGTLLGDQLGFLE